jgi:hypothetical protein
LSDDDLILRVRDRSFGDEWFKVHDPSNVVVLAQLPKWMELLWHRDLATRLGADLKWGAVRAHWRDLGADLRRSILVDLRDALISIVDPTIYRVDLVRSIEERVKRSRGRWPAAFRQLVDGLTEKYERQSILGDSPVRRIQRFLEDDGDSVGGIGGIDGNFDDDRSVLGEIDGQLKKAHSVRLFGARSAAAFSYLVDPGERAKALTSLRGGREFLTPEVINSRVFAFGERIQRVFDEGNQPSVLAIGYLKTAIRNRLHTGGRIVLTNDVPAGVLEARSIDEPMVQAADLAGGYAADLYRKHGLRVVCEEFKGVILNGAMVRDWQQIERADLTRLRT